MKLSLLTIITIIFCGLNSFSQANQVIDTSQIKPAIILNNEYNYVCGWDKRNAVADYFTYFFQERNITAERYEGLTVTIKQTLFNSIYHVYLQNLKTKKLEFVSNIWVEDQSKKSAKLFVSVKYFKDAMKYKLLIIPTIRTSNRIVHVYSKSVKIFNAAAFFVNVFSYRNHLITNIFTLLILFPPLFFGIRNARAVKAEKLREKAQLQLEAVRSQLNPHFLFNALAGIQTLMNTDQTEQANRYLTRFSRLTRAVLKSTDLISLDEERNLLDDYLQMEQLRFNFKYDITIDSNLDLHNTEIPSMLLQPFIENSVKHGIASMGNDGQININIFKINDDLILKIEDNGKGFDTSKTHEGLGFSLSTKRIALLNKIYKKDPILLSMESHPGNTTVSITLTKWL